jgi:hypothetical protein
MPGGIALTGSEIDGRRVLDRHPSNLIISWLRLSHERYRLILWLLRLVLELLVLLFVRRLLEHWLLRQGLLLMHVLERLLVVLMLSLRLHVELSLL